MGFGDGTHEDANGTYVKYEDYAILKDEVERLKVEADWKTPALKIKALEAEVNRLRALDSLKTVSLTDSTNWKIIGAYAEQKDESEGLRKEVERLQKDVWRMKVFKGMDEDNIKTLKAALKTSPEWSKTLETIDENAYLKAELERLKKDYDTIFQDRALMFQSLKETAEAYLRSHHRCLSAKESKISE